MKFHSPHFRSGVALTCFIAVLAMNMSHLPGLNQIGVLACALLLGIASRALLHIPEPQETGIHFSAKHLIRIGTVLVGVRCNFELLAHIGPRIFVIVASVVIAGMIFIVRLGRMAGLSQTLSLLLAFDTTICGASAVASVAPTIGAKKEEVALAIPLGSLIGAIGLLGMNAWIHLTTVRPLHFGILAGASLQEVAQVMTAVSFFPASMESGIATKFLRILFLAPTILFVGIFLEKQSSQVKKSQREKISIFINATWFVFGFLLIGIIHTLAERSHYLALVATVDHVVLAAATFLMAMAMAGVGLQVRLEYLWQHGWRVIAVAVAGWFFILLVAVVEIQLLQVK